MRTLLEFVRDAWRSFLFAAGDAREVARRRPTMAPTDALIAVGAAFSLAEEWETLADRCEKQLGAACSTCAHRRAAADQLRKRIGGVER